MRKHAWMKILLAAVVLALVAAVVPTLPAKTVAVEQTAQTPASKPARVILLAGDDACLGYAQSYRLQDNRMSTDVSKEKYAEYTDGYDNVLISYRTMLNSSSTHARSDGFVPVALGQGYVTMGLKGGAFGPEVGLAEVMSAYYPDQTTYIVKFAGGGTSGIRTQWTPNGGAYYNAMTEFFAESLALLTAQGIDFEVSAFCFMQGESDARYNYSDYDVYLREFVDAVKLDYAEYAPSDGMAFVDVGVAQFFIHYDRLNAMKSAMADADARTYFVDTVAAGLNGQYDSLQRRYMDSISTIKLGQLIGKTVRESFAPVTLASPLRPTKRPVACSVNGQTLSSFADGLCAQLNWNAYRNDGYLYFEADVRDALLTAGDGVELTFGTAANQRDIPFRTVRVTMYADGSMKAEQYYDGAFHTTSTLLNYQHFYGYLTDDGSSVSGYHVGFVVPMQDEPAVHVALLNQNAAMPVRKSFTGLCVKENDFGSWVRATKQGAVASPFRKGAFFGGNGVLSDVGMWDLSGDTATGKQAVLVQNDWINVLYAEQMQSTQFYFEVELSARGVFGGDQWPKFGIQLTTAANTGLFYYVDAYGNGTQMYGRNLGYARRVSATAFDSYTFTAENVVGTAAAYQNGSFVKLAVYRNGSQIVMLFHDRVITTLDTFGAIGTRPVFVGIGSFNVTLTARNYSLVSGTAAEQAYREALYDSPFA